MLRVLHEFRHGCRVLLRNPGFSIVALLTIALGAGAAIAIYTVVNSTLLSPLPYADPDRLFMLWWADPGNDEIPVSPADFHDWRQENKSFEVLAAYHPWSFTLTGEGETERIRAVVVTSGLFELLGAKPRVGRSFDSDGPGAPAAVILSDELWTSRFGGDPDILGKQLLLDDKPFEVFGVMPAGFRFPPASSPALWKVFSFGPADLPREMRFLRVLGRSKQGVRPVRAQAEMSAIAARHEEQFPDTNTGLGASVKSLRETVVKDHRQALLYLQLAVLLALVIACLNVAILQLARASVRRGEVAMRLALGAGRGQIFRQLLIENLVLGLCGGALGLVVAHWGVRLLVRAGPQAIYRLEAAAIDGRVLAFALLVTLASGLLFGLAPSFQSSRSDFSPILRQTGRSTIGSIRMRNLFIFLQVAITLILLVGAGLLIRSFENLSSVAPGFRVENLLTMQVNLPESRATVEKTATFYRELKERLETLPGVESFATSFYLPLAGGMDVDNDFEIEGRPHSPSDPKRNAQIRPVSPDFFNTMGISLIAGRIFTEDDRADTPGVAVLNQEAARLYWPGVDPIGGRLKARVDFGAQVGRFENDSWEIVGIVGDVKEKGLEHATRPEIYLSAFQGSWPILNLIVRTSLDPAGLVKPIAAEVHAIEPSLPIEKVRTIEQVIAESLSQPRFNTWLLSLFAAFALGLTVIGLYGVLSYSVQQRTQEIGLRMALGARKQDVLWLVVSRAMFVVLAGLAAGLVGALFFVRFLSGLLFGVSSTDPATFAVVTVILSLVALAASYLPARRAAGLDPMSALHYE